MFIIFNDILFLSKKLKSIIYFLKGQIEELLEYLEGNLSRLILIETHISEYYFINKTTPINDYNLYLEFLANSAN